MRAARWLILGSSIVLLLAAVLHANGYRGVSGMVQAGIADASVVSALKVVWLSMFVSQVVLAVVVVAASTIADGKRIILLAAMIPLADTALLMHFVGIFIGTILLALATVLLVAGGLLLPHPSSP